MTMRPLKNGSAKVYALFDKDEILNDPRVVDTLYSTIVNRTTALHEVSLVYPNECRKCAASPEVPLLVFMDGASGESASTVTLDDKATVVGFTRLDITAKEVLKLKNCPPDSP